MNYIAVCFISVVVVGLMEVVKNFLPKDIDKRITSGISLGLAVLLPIGYGIVTKMGAVPIITSTVGVIGLTQTSYNFVLKLFKTQIEKLQANIIEKVTKK